MFAVLSSPFHVERLWGFLFSVDSFCDRDGAARDAERCRRQNFAAAVQPCRIERQNLLQKKGINPAIRGPERAAIAAALAGP